MKKMFWIALALFVLVLPQFYFAGKLRPYCANMAGMFTAVCYQPFVIFIGALISGLFVYFKGNRRLFGWSVILATTIVIGGMVLENGLINDFLASQEIWQGDCIIMGIDKDDDFPRQPPRVALSCQGGIYFSPQLEIADKALRTYKIVFPCRVFADGHAECQ